MALFTPDTPYDPEDAVTTTQAILIEYLQWYLDQKPNAEGALVFAGFPSFDGKLPLQRPHITVYRAVGLVLESVGFDDVFDPRVVDGGDTYIERGEYQTFSFNVDTWTSIGTVDHPSRSGGTAVRDRVKGLVVNALSREWFYLPENVEVREVRDGIDQQPIADADQDICLGRLTVGVRVPSTYRILLPA